MEKRMRVTTQMLNRSAIKAGLPINRNSLLNYINNNSSQNTFLDALNKRKTNTANKEKKSEYEKLGTAAEQLQKKAELFAASEKSSLFEEAVKSGNNQKIYTNAEKFVENYNETVKSLQSASDPLGSYYYKMLKENTAENKEMLGEIGITIAKDGTLNLDKDKLKAANLETVEKVFGASGTFSARAAFLATRVFDYAKANAKAVSSQYNSGGNMETFSFNQYNFWG